MLGTVAGARGELLPLLDPAPLPEPDERGTRGDAAALEDDAAEAEDSPEPLREAATSSWPGLS